MNVSPKSAAKVALGSTGSSPVTDALTRGGILAALVEFLELVGVRPEIIENSETLLIVASFLLWGVVDLALRWLASRVPATDVSP